MHGRVAARAAVAAVLGAVALVALFAPLSGLVKLVPDDGFYYLEIARRIGAGQGSTFDGVHPTNGYHPLWLAVLVPAAPILEASRIAGVRVALLLGVGFFAGAAALVDRAAARAAPSDAALGPLWLAATTLGASVYGMETPLAVLLAASTWTIVSRGWPETLGGGVALGGATVALALARLDTAVLGAVADLVWLVTLVRARGPLLPWVATVGVQLVGAAGFVAWNVAVFDAWLPISAELKASRQGGPNLVWARSLLALCGIASAGFAAVALALAPPGEGPRERGARVAVAAGTLAAMALLAVGGGRETYNWYFAVATLGGAWVLPGVASALVARGFPRRILHAAVWLACLGLLAVTGRGKLVPTGFSEKIARAQWLADHAPPDAVFAEGDCGILGYVSERPFVNLDGLTNTAVFLDAIDAGTVAPWLLEAGVNAVAVPTGAEGSPPTATLVPRGRHHGQKVRLKAALSPWEPPVTDAVYTLWRIHGLEPELTAGGAPPAR